MDLQCGNDGDGAVADVLELPAGALPGASIITLISGSPLARPPADAAYDAVGTSSGNAASFRVPAAAVRLIVERSQNSSVWLFPVFRDYRALLGDCWPSPGRSVF